MWTMKLYFNITIKRNTYIDICIYVCIWKILEQVFKDQLGKRIYLTFFILFQGQDVQPHSVIPFLCMKYNPLKALFCFS